MHGCRFGLKKGVHPVRKLAPHSPFLNPIENMFSVFKADLEQRLSYVQDRLDDRAAAPAAGHRSLVTLRSLFFHPGCTATRHEAHVVCVHVPCGSRVLDWRYWVMDAMHACNEGNVYNKHTNACTLYMYENACAIHFVCMYTCTSVFIKCELRDGWLAFGCIFPSPLHLLKVAAPLAAKFVRMCHAVFH